MRKDNVIYKTEKLENPTRLRVKEQLGILGNSHYVRKNNERYLCYSANCKKEKKQIHLCSSLHSQKDWKKRKIAKKSHQALHSEKSCQNISKGHHAVSLSIYPLIRKVCILHP